jgi:hypothetical protein
MPRSLTLACSCSEGKGNLGKAEVLAFKLMKTLSPGSLKQDISDEKCI